MRIGAGLRCGLRSMVSTFPPTPKHSRLDGPLQRHTHRDVRLKGVPRIDRIDTVGSLNPAQAQVLELLGSQATERPSFDPVLADELEALLEERLSAALEAASVTEDGEPIEREAVFWLSKHGLSEALGCEAKWLAERQTPFTYDPVTAKGSVAHKAIELAIFWRDDIPPMDLIGEAMERLQRSDNALADYLGNAEPAEIAEVMSSAQREGCQVLRVFSANRYQVATGPGVSPSSGTLRPADCPFRKGGSDPRVRPWQHRGQGDHRLKDRRRQPSAPRGPPFLCPYRTDSHSGPTAQGRYLLPRVWQAGNRRR